MLGGIAPIFLFNFFKLSKEQQAVLNNKVPLIGSLVNAIGLPPIPLYLDENLTGILVDNESKSIDLETDMEGKKDGTEPLITQRPLNSTITIDMIAKKNSVGLVILSAMMDVILPKVTSREYSISYLHGGVTVFSAQLHAFSISQNSNTDLANISVQLTNGTKKVTLPTPADQVLKSTGIRPL